MPNIEGAVRMRKAGKFIIISGLSLAVLGATSFVVLWMSRLVIFGNVVVTLMIYWGILSQIFGAALWISGWILEGFLAPPKQEHDLQ